MIKYTINFKTQWENGWPIIIHFLLWPIGFFILNWYYLSQNIDESRFLAVFLGCFFLFFFILQITVHLNYYLLNRTDAFFYDAATERGIFIHNDVEFKFSKDEVSLLVFHTSFAAYKRNVQFLPWDSYFHFTITLKDGTSITMTSLMVGEDFQLPVSKWKRKVRLSLFRYVKGPSLFLPPHKGNNAQLGKK
jgi:hypothetical protein